MSLFNTKHIFRSYIQEGRGLLSEIQLDIKNAADIKEEDSSGSFNVGGIEYTYHLQEVASPFWTSAGILTGTIYNIGFSETTGDISDTETFMRKKGTNNLVRIYSTMYRVLLNLISKKAPNYIILFSFDKAGYYPVYNELLKTNKIPGYNIKSRIQFEENNEPATGLILKKSGKIETLAEMLK